MKKRLTKLGLLLLICIPAYASAGGEDKANPETSSEINPESEYLSRDQVTRDDYNTMSEFSADYNECLTQTSRAEVVNYNDPRHVVDVAMKQCAVKLEALNIWFTEKRFPPDFKKRYIRKISGDSVGQVLPEVMYLMSIKQPVK